MALTGALLLTSAPTASADYVRDQQWVLDAFRMQDTWAVTQGEGVTVAVVDSGVDASHPDLTGQVLEGKDFTGGGNAQEDLFGHGTSMASIIAGHGHGAKNESGMVGFAPKAKILPLRAIQKKSDDFEDETWAEAVHYAVDKGAKVINLSFGDSHSRTLSEGREAIAYAQAHDVVVVASSGNEGILALNEPAGLPGVVSVGAVDKYANVWEKSNSGKGLTLVAPGVDIVAANKHKSNGYSLADGTSAATAYVSATAALVRAKYPDLTAGQVINRLIKSASFLDHKGLKAPDREYGYGIIRPNKALTMDIPEGPKEGPLGKVQQQSSTSNSGNASDGNNSSAPQAKQKSSSGSIFVIAGIAAVVVIAGIAIAVIRSRRNRGNGGPGRPGGGYPNHSSCPPAGTPHNPGNANSYQRP
ncbi:type VII secretion-associated serine protease mycosin [Streptomyces sp. ISL-99]|uniref:type VII secretion-associated serine protease mycosin n=1 Tax=Streptomyces sp. ISL-99 TaxID=2819193 RepID=UPI0027E49B2B|nr:type VII secretion-associated serine protease mycosin [Streptomyces sp. ISL-99]